MAISIVPTIWKPDHSKSGHFCPNYKWFATRWQPFVPISNGWASRFQISFEIQTYPNFRSPMFTWRIELDRNLPDSVARMHLWHGKVSPWHTIVKSERFWLARSFDIFWSQVSEVFWLDCLGVRSKDFSNSLNFFNNNVTLLELHKVQWDLNCQLFWYSEHGDLFDCRMFCYLDAWYLGSLVFDHHLVNWLVFRPPFEYGSAIQMPGTLVPGIWITNHLKNEYELVFHINPVQLALNPISGIQGY